MKINETLSLMNTDLSQTEKRAKERQQRINHDGQKLKAHLNEQQRRLENSKSELMKVIFYDIIKLINVRYWWY